MTKINITNVTDMTADVDVDMLVGMASDMDAEVYDDVTITTHLFMGQYQKWPM
jgi:hypothetical protein